MVIIFEANKVIKLAGHVVLNPSL